jgi:hypothetical protein
MGSTYQPGGYWDLTDAIVGLKNLIDCNNMDDGEGSVASDGGSSAKRVRLDPVVTKQEVPAGRKRRESAGKPFPYRPTNWLLGKQEDSPSWRPYRTGRWNERGRGGSSFRGRG